MQYHCQCVCIVVAVVVAAAKLLIALVASRERRNGILPFRIQAENVGFRVSTVYRSPHQFGQHGILLLALSIDGNLNPKPKGPKGFSVQALLVRRPKRSWASTSARKIWALFQSPLSGLYRRLYRGV